eukprot:4173586-Prymnesium_polylepis.1
MQRLAAERRAAGGTVGRGAIKADSQLESRRAQPCLGEGEGGLVGVGDARAERVALERHLHRGGG